MFFPKKTNILEKLVQQSITLEKCAEVFSRIPKEWKKRDEICDELKQIESEGDKFVHIITDEIEMVFILPLDKEDIKELSEMMDDIIDFMEQAANRLKIYNVEENKEMLSSLKEFAKLITRSVKQIRLCIELISARKIRGTEFPNNYKILHDIENEGDHLHRGILGELFRHHANDALLIIKWKEIFGLLEDTLDRCEDVASLCERLRIKYT
jgi:predicted phosphate transport protein (TIGR00153 family)